MTGDRRLASGQRLHTGAPTSGALRVARGAVVGATALGLALVGHVTAGGSVPTSSSAVALLGLSMAGSIALSGRRWTVSALLTVLIAVQVVFHVALGDHPAGAGTATHRHAAHSMSASMLLAHLLAALTTALLLRRGEAWCWHLVALLSRPVHVARVLGAIPVSTSRARSLPAAAGTLPVLRSLLLAAAAPRRGPPVLLAR